MKMPISSWTLVTPIAPARGRFLPLLVALVVGSLSANHTFAQSPLPDGLQRAVVDARAETGGETAPEVSTEELHGLLVGEQAVVLDARPFMEFATGHIPGAINVAAKPGVDMALYVSDVAEIDRIVGGRKDTPLVLYCNGPFCGKSKRLAEELGEAGYTNVRRYQAGIPVWRALGGVTQVEPEGAHYIYESDRSSWFVDARSPEVFLAGSLPGAKNVWAGEVHRAKSDGRVPMEDHNTRIVVFGQDADQARAVAEELTQNAFHNVGFFAGNYSELREALGLARDRAPRVFSTSEVADPGEGELTFADVHESDRMVTRVMRLAPGAEIAEHHHPFFAEAFVVQQGRLVVSLDGVEYELQEGDVVHIPAGTVITGANEGSEEAVVTVVWSSTGRSGPLTVPGHPSDEHLVGHP